MTKQVTVANVKTMADGSIRITIDLLNGNSKDMADVYDLINKDATIMLCASDKIVDEVHELAEELLNVSGQ